MGYWDNVKGRWQGMVDGDWDKVTNFQQNQPAQQNRQRPHSHSSEVINTKVVLHEGEHRAWSINVDSTTPFLLSLQHVDGSSITAYVLSDQEYCNFRDNYQFYPTTKLVHNGREGIHLGYGTHYVVARLPQSRDGRAGRAVGLLRLDEYI